VEIGETDGQKQVAGRLRRGLMGDKRFEGKEGQMLVLEGVGVGGGVSAKRLNKKKDQKEKWQNKIMSGGKGAESR